MSEFSDSMEKEMSYGYAYIDRTGTLHIVDSMETAIEHSAPGKNVVETTLTHDGGYPVIDGKTVIYEDGKAYVNGNSNDGHLIATPFLIIGLVNQIG